MTENILWNGNNCSYYVLVLTNVFIDYLFFVLSLCISLQQISLNRVFALYVSYIILTTLSSINFKCSFHDKVSSNRMPSNSNMSFYYLIIFEILWHRQLQVICPTRAMKI